MSLGVFLGLFFYVAWPYGERFGPDTLSRKEWLPAEVFLWLDPLAGVSAAVAGRAWNVALLGAAGVFALGILAPRGFCGYLCPLGTLIDLFDWGIGKRVRWLRIRPIGAWRQVRYGLLTAVLAGAAFGVLLSGYVAAMPVLTRGLVFTMGRAQLAWMKNPGLLWAADAAMYLSVGLFAAVFLVGLLGPRFWCREVCPSGAILSVMALLSIGRRKVGEKCNGCGRCARACPFDAIEKDFTARRLDCAFCQTCGGVCPTGAIEFVWGGDGAVKSLAGEGRGLSRRAFVGWGVGGALATGVTRRVGGEAKLLRPPGSVGEREFLGLCVRCGECFKVCPGSVLQPAGFDAGLEAMWTPVAVPTHAGCHQDCNFCTQVCPTGAIRPLSIEQKRRTRMGLAVIDAKLCLPHRGERDCQLCYDECEAAGYHAIEMRWVKLKMGDVPAGVVSDAEMAEMSRINAPLVDAGKCVGCGLCEYRCNSVLVRQQKLLGERAVNVVATGR